jgi:hypothetical protein
VVADFDGDGLNDLVGTGTGLDLSLARGLSARTWATATPVSLPGDVFVYGIVTGDFNKDGKADIAFASRVPTYGASTVVGGVHVLLGTGSMTPPFFNAAPGSPIVSLGTTLNGVYVVDFDKDGKLDLVVASSDVAVLFGDGTGQFGRPIVATGAGIGSTSDTTVFVYPGDFTGDGLFDLLTWVPTSGALPGMPSGMPVRLFVGNASGFSAPTLLPMPNFKPSAFDQAVLVGDLNGDGKPDLVTTSGLWLQPQPTITTVLINAK